jgi:hypothetical protein
MLVTLFTDLSEHILTDDANKHGSEKEFVNLYNFHKY